MMRAVTEWVVDYWRALAGGLAVVAVIAGLCVWAAIDQGSREAHCHSLGGHVVSHDETGVGANGGVAVTTTNLCLSSDGRVLEIW